MPRWWLLFILTVLAAAMSGCGSEPASVSPAGSVHVAVAANFSAPMEKLAALFESETGFKAVFSAGSTGQLYAQAVEGGPFDVFLSADEARARLLEESDSGVAGSRFTYAVGALVLISASTPVDAGGLDVLRASGDWKLAIANPDLAPYGKAAEQALRKAGLWDAVSTKLVLGQNIEQTRQFVATGAAEFGLVALSSVTLSADLPSDRVFPVPSNMHEAIRQDAVLLRRGAQNPAATRFLNFLQGDAARKLILECGYALP